MIQTIKGEFEMEPNKIYIHQIMEEAKYPSKDDCFNPSECYPEYIFPGDISGMENVVYASIRECFYNMGFDQAHYGTKEWNPLGELIQPNDVVLLKPNMVLDTNEKHENGMDCLITHPSLVRAMLDYVALALKGTGSIIVGDAPLQSCNFEKLVQEQGYLDIIEFYRNKGIDIKLVDFRNYKTVEHGGILHQVKDIPAHQGIRVDLGRGSEFHSFGNERFKRLRITNYEHSEMYQHHNCETNEYLIAPEILKADVIINMPKPKTHRKAGVTISLKNLIGINTNKEWLPHHSQGSVKEGGDEYLRKSWVKKARTYWIEKKDTYMTCGAYQKAKLCQIVSLGFHVLAKLFVKETYAEGSWYGNDTIWRTILDLNKIIFFADKQGKMQREKQRKMLIVADMIISGEEEGPLLPTPKSVGIIAMGLNPVCFDEAITSIMGFSPSLIPSICNAHKVKKYSITETAETKILSNNPVFNMKKPNEIMFEESLQFKPSSGWRALLNMNQSKQ